MRIFVFPAAKLDEIDSPTLIETVRGVGFTTAERP